MNGQNKWASRKLVALAFGGLVLVLLAYWRADPSYAMTWGGIVTAYIGMQGWQDRAEVGK
mgnify:FL=1